MQNQLHLAYQKHLNAQHDRVPHNHARDIDRFVGCVARHKQFSEQFAYCSFRLICNYLAKSDRSLVSKAPRYSLITWIYHAHLPQE